MNYQQMNEKLVNQLERYGLDFDKYSEVYEVADRTSGAAIGESYHNYLTDQLNAYKEAKQAELTELQASFYQQQVESMKQQQEQLTKPEYQISREEVLNLNPEEAVRLRRKIGASAYQSIMEGKQTPINQLLEEESNDSHETYEQYHGRQLTDILPSVAVDIKRHAPEIYNSLT